MTDHLTKDKRSWNMSRIRSRHTKPELILRSLLHRSGFRFRINYNKLPGSPDIVLPKYKTVIFVHGCFWHRHPNCSKATTPNTNRPYWKKKFDKNVSRDIEIRKELKRLKWRIIVVWECEVMVTFLRGAAGSQLYCLGQCISVTVILNKQMNVFNVTV